MEALIPSFLIVTFPRPALCFSQKQSRNDFTVKIQSPSYAHRFQWTRKSSMSSRSEVVQRVISGRLVYESLLETIVG